MDSLLELVTLTAGEHSEEVRQLQQALNSLEYNCGQEDGYFGERTQAALLDVQRHFGLQQSGIFDSSTWCALSFWAQEELSTSVQAFSQPWKQLLSGISAAWVGMQRHTSERSSLINT